MGLIFDIIVVVDVVVVLALLRFLLLLHLHLLHLRFRLLDIGPLSSNDVIPLLYLSKQPLDIFAHPDG